VWLAIHKQTTFYTISFLIFVGASGIISRILSIHEAPVK